MGGLPSAPCHLPPVRGRPGQVGRGVLRALVFACMACAPAAWAAAFQLDWVAPPCAPEPPLAAFLDAAGAGHAVVTVAPGPTGYAVEVRFLAPQPGLRRVEARDCEEAARTATLLLKLGLGREAPRPRTVVETPVVAPAPAPASRRWTLAAGASAEGLAWPGLHARPLLTGSVEVGEWALAGDARVGLPRRLPLAAGGSSAVDVSAPFEASVEACRPQRAGPLRIGPCAGLVVGAWQLTGVNLSRSATGLAPGVAAQLGVRAELSLPPPFVLIAHVAARAHAVRPAAALSGGAVLLESGVVGVEALLALGVAP